MHAFVLIVVSLMLSLDAVWWWLTDRWARTLPRRRWWRGGIAVFTLAHVGMLAMLILVRRDVAMSPAITMLMLVTFVWHLLILPTAVLLHAVGGIGKGAAWIVGRFQSRPVEPNEDAPPNQPLMSRRQMLAAGAVVALPPLINAVGSMRAVTLLDEFRVRRLTLGIPALPAELDGMTIAQVADVHVGDFTNGRTLSRIAQAANDLRADLVLMPGDLINRRLSDLPAAMDMVNQMDARQGVYLCEGNHDLFEGREAFAQGVRQRGGQLLVDQTQTVQINGRAVQLLGLPWGGSRRVGDDEMAAAVASIATRIEPDAFPLMLAHHPHAFDAAAAVGIPLTISGHTHGGQLHLSSRLGFGPLMYRYWSGLYRRSDAQLVVSNGVGNWFPLRINAPAEIVHLTLRRS